MTDMNFAAARAMPDASPRHTAIAVRQLGKRVADAAGELTILHDVDFSVQAGETLAIVGASGSGKSTRLGLLAGLDLPSSGTVELEGADIFQLDEDGRAIFRQQNVGLVFQSFQLLAHLTALARAFVCEPPLLLADEPTGSLDAATGEAVIQLMFALNRERGSTLVLVTHDLSIAARCGRTLTMNAGRLLPHSHE